MTVTGIFSYQQQERKAISIAFVEPLKESTASALPLMSKPICDLLGQNSDLVLTCCSFVSLSERSVHLLTPVDRQSCVFTLTTAKQFHNYYLNQMKTDFSSPKYTAAQFFNYFLANEPDKHCLMSKLSYTNKSTNRNKLEITNLTVVRLHRQCNRKYEFTIEENPKQHT